ncbi:MAG: serine/threonine protein kinase [Lysobacter sp.]|nr:MAG: serine/threonine protein kinase [Lysobacter sp.]
MDASRWQRLSPHLDALLELAPEARAARLAGIRIEDPALADELSTMLALEDGRDDFLAEPLIAPRALLREGSEIGPYRLESLLGEGGMGQVWRASRADGLYQRRVALKLLRPGLADENLRLRFARERQILARLAHPHIAGLLDAGVSPEGVPYLALEYVEGEPITRYWQRFDVPLPARLRMFRQVCAAVSHAHANLIVHCDLKPSNILVTQDGQVRLLDFGIAKLLDGAAPRIDHTRTGGRAFTLHYAAPEQIRGGPVTTMTDVYSLGVVLYELLTGTKPYRLKRQSDAEWEEAILAYDPVRPSQMLLRQSELKADRTERQLLRRRANRLSGDLDNIVMRTLCKQPDERYPSVEAMSQDLQHHLDGLPVQARPQGMLYRARKFMGRHRWSLAAAVAAFALISVAAGVTWWQSRLAFDEARRAQAMRGFIVGVFEGAGETPDGRALDLRSLLDAAVVRGDRELTREPRAQAELLGLIARLRTGLGDYSQASALLDRQQRLLGNAGVPENLRIESLAQRGEVLRKMGHADGCVATMAPLLGDVRDEQSASPVQAAEFYSQLGRCRRVLGASTGARDLFQRALALRREVRAPGAAVAGIESQLDLAGLEADIGDTDTALHDYAQARARLDAEVGARHPLQVEIGRQVAALRRQRGEPGRAERELVDMLGIAQALHGARHPVTLAVRRELADALIDQFRFRDAALPLRTRHAVLASRVQPGPELRASHLALARVEWELDRLPAALGSLQSALALSRRGGDAGQVAESLFALGQTLHEAGRNSEAMPLLREARQLRLEQYGSANVRVAEVDRVLGETEAALGLPSAIPRLLRAEHFLALGYGPIHPQTRLARLALARQRAAHGEREGMQALQELAASARGTTRPQPIAWRAAAYADAIRCNGRQRLPSLRRLARLNAAVSEAQPDGSVTAREITRLLRQCQRPRIDFMPTGTL